MVTMYSGDKSSPPIDYQSLLDELPLPEKYLLRSNAPWYDTDCDWSSDPGDSYSDRYGDGSGPHSNQYSLDNSPSDNEGITPAQVTQIINKITGK